MKLYEEHVKVWFNRSTAKLDPIWDMNGDLSLRFTLKTCSAWFVEHITLCSLPFKQILIFTKYLQIDVHKYKYLNNAFANECLQIQIFTNVFVNGCFQIQISVHVFAN